MFPSKKELSQFDSSSQSDEQDRPVEDKNNAFKIDREIFQKENNRSDDLHLQLSEKYMIYKDYAERAMTNPQHLGKEDHTVWYMRPDSVFLQEPRLQNQFRNEFIRQISAPPMPEPFTLMMDDVHKALIEDIRYRNDPDSVREEMTNFFKRRQYRLQHKKHKYVQRWSHFALTSELVDKVSLKFSPNYSKLQFELENSVKRWQRLDGDDHFSSKELRPQRLEQNGEISIDDRAAEKLPKYCSLRADDLDVYTRIVGYEEKCHKSVEKFVNRAKWVPMTHRFDIYTQAQDYFQKCRNDSAIKQRVHADRVKDKSNDLIDRKKMGDRGYKEMSQLMNALPHVKEERRNRGLRDEYLQKAKSNYDLPPMVLWNQVELKLSLEELSKHFGIFGEMELDNGNSFSYAIIVQFPTFFHEQVLRSQFANYDALPTMLHPSQLGKKNMQKVLKRNLKKYGKTQGQNTLLERIDIQKESGAMKIEYINQIERALFGEYNNGQLEEVPKVRLKKSFWLDWICFKPELSNEQQQQAALLSGEMNPIDECAACMMEIININDVTNVNLTLESIAQIHSDKIKHGKVKTDFLNTDHADTESYLAEEQRSFFSLFSNSLQTKQDLRGNSEHVSEELPKNSLFETPQHLLFAHYLLQCLSSREKKNQLLYTLNAFRAIQKRITLELRELGSRDRVVGDCNVMKPNEHLTVSKNDDLNDQSAGRNGGGAGGQHDSMPSVNVAQAQSSAVGDIDNIVMDELVDINRFRYNNLFTNKQMSTCPILPKFHITYGHPIDRQEISAEYEQTKDSDPKKQQAANLLGRVDKIEEHKPSKCMIVTDDFGVNVMYDATFGDMRAIEQEMLRIISFYINKIEPIAEVDFRNIFPSVDRFAIVQEILDCEERFQRAKLRLCLNYVECFEHTCDSLDQQRIIQIIIDLMAKRPRINLEGNHFRDSYKAEVEALEMQAKLINEFIKMQMDIEFKANQEVREYLEKTYEIIYQQIDNEWQYYPQGDIKDEVTKRQTQKFGVKTDEDEQKLNQIMKEKPGMFAAKQTTIDPKQFAEMLGMPYSSLLMLMKEHHERDPIVKTSIHEHVSFIKVQEGYPIFIFDGAVKKQNKIKITEMGKEIGILDFYESLAFISKVVSVCHHSCDEIHEVHRPDNGLISAALDLCTFKFLLAELRAVKGEERGDSVSQNRDLDLIQDDTIVGNSDKMLFHTKELIATLEDPKLLSDPMVMSKLDLETLNEYEFDLYQENNERTQRKKLEEAMNQMEQLEEVKAVEDEIADAYAKQMGVADDDFEKKTKLHQKEKNNRYPRLKQKQMRLNIPSQLQLMCNGVEVMRMRHLLVQTIIQREVLQKIYFDQMKSMDNSGARLYFNDSFNFETFITGGGNWINFVDGGPGLKTVIPTTYSIKEFDVSMTAALNFSDHEAFKALICPMGLEELRLVLRYELTNLNMLVVATRTNQVLLDNSLRQLAEIDMFSRGFTVTAPAFDISGKLIGTNLYENNLKRMPELEKARLQDFIRSQLKPFYYDVIRKKAKSKVNIEKSFQKFRLWINKQTAAGQKDEVQLRLMRSTRMLLCHDYCEELSTQCSLDFLKLELLHETNQMRMRAYLLPRDSRIHHIFPAKCGEHQYAAYSEDAEDEVPYTPFFDTDLKKITNFFQIPSFKEIMQLDQQQAKFTHLNQMHLYAYDIQNPLTFDETQKPSLLQNEQVNLIKIRLPKLTMVDLKETDTSTKEKLRHVDFKEAYNLTGNLTMKYIYYFRNLQNLFDLEFFCNKLPSNTRGIAGLEQNVMSGLPFWEEGDDAIFGDNDDYLDDKNMNDPQYSKQNEDIETKYKNQVTMKVTIKMQNQKKQKMQLMQELDSIKDHFNEWQTAMRCQELDSDLFQAANFLSEQVQNTYLVLILVLMNLQDLHGSAGTCQKEMHEIRHAIKLLTHQEDTKITFTNGFHINTAVTATSRISLDENCYRPDYNNFYKCTQPVIDEQGINPAEFNLLAGIYLGKHNSMRTLRKERKYIGILPKRDFSYLDCKLLNLDLTIRKYIPGTMVGFEGQAKTYAHTRLKIKDEKSYVANANLTREVFHEKKTFNRHLIRSRQLKRALMILMSKNTLPTESKALQELLEETNEIVSWKIMQKMDSVERNRQLAAEQNRAKRVKLLLSQDDPVKQIAKSLQKSLQPKAEQTEQERAAENILQQYDEACCQVEVYQREIQNYMILVAKKLIERETKSLAKAYEMNGKRLEILVHPTQQFASTFDQQTDKRNHLDIINMVGPVQRMLTQLKNRCLEIETLTSGHGVVISSKDLNEVLRELCRSIVQNGQIEMRSRCEQLYLLIKEYENLLYSKDQQLLNLEAKLKHAKEEINKIVNTKVFSRGNNLIYELDKSARQLRLIKDNIYSLESGVKEKVRLYYEKDLSDTRMLLAEVKNNFGRYRENMSASLKADVADNINQIEERMKVRIEKEEVPKKFASKTDQLVNKYSQLLKQGGDGYGGISKENTAMLFEMERLKESEAEAREEVLAIQKFMKLERLFAGFKQGVRQSKHDFKIDNLKQQLTSNSCLWEQLAEAEKREKILKQELELSQHEIAMQEKIIDRLKSDIKSEQREKQKLIQYRQSKSKRLDELEQKAREFEVLENVNLHKLLSMMEKKQRRIDALEKQEHDQDTALDKLMAVANSKVKSAQEKANLEAKMKTEAFNKIVEMKTKKEMMMTLDEQFSIDYWKTKHDSLEKELQEMKDENLKILLMLSNQQNEMKNTGTFRSTDLRVSDSKMINQTIVDLILNSNKVSIKGQKLKSNKDFEDSIQSINRDMVRELNSNEFSASKKPSQDRSYQILPKDRRQSEMNAEDDFRKQIHLPSILGIVNQQASHQQIPNKKLLPQIKNELSERNEEKKANTFRPRNRSVGPQMQKPAFQSRKINLQPKAVFGQNSSQLVYEDPTSFNTQARVSSFTKDPSHAYQMNSPSNQNSIEQPNYEKSVFNTFGTSISTGIKAHNGSSNFLLTPMKPVFGNAKLGENSNLVSKTQRNQPKMTQQRQQLNHVSTNLFNSLISYDQNSPHTHNNSFITGKPSIDTDHSRHTKIIVGEQTQLQNTFAGQQSHYQSTKVVNTSDNDPQIVAAKGVMSTNTMNLGQGAGTQSGTQTITEKSNDDQTNVSFLQNRRLSQ